MTPRRANPFVVLAAVAVLAPRSALAGDGAYGRLDGDLDLGLGIGAGYASTAPAFVARASAVYAATAGLYVGYADAFGAEGALVDRSIAAGVTLKPLFWARFANAWETGPARWDLFLDSFVFEVGAFWAAPHARPIEEAPGLEVAAGIGFPILASATGPYIELRGALRYRPRDLDGSVRSDVGDRGAMVSLTLAWHHVVNAHIADAGDRAVR